MTELVRQILNHKELADLPLLTEKGGLPALISGLSAVQARGWPEGRIILTVLLPAVI